MLFLAPMAIALVACNEKADQGTTSVVQTQPDTTDNSGATDNSNDNTGDNNGDDNTQPLQGFEAAYHCRLPEPELYLLRYSINGKNVFWCLPCSEDPKPSRDVETNYSVCDINQLEEPLTTE